MIVKKAFRQVFIVLGGGLLTDGALPEYVVSRVNLCISSASPRDAIIFSSRYSLNCKPKLDARGFPKSEAKSMLDYFVKNSGTTRNLFLENASTDSIGSALFIRLLFGSFFKNKIVTIITSDFHKKRVELIFNKVLLRLSPSLDIERLEFLSAPSLHLTRARQLHEVNQMQLFESEYGKIDNLEDFKLHLLTYHHNYNSKYRSKEELPEEYLY